MDIDEIQMTAEEAMDKAIQYVKSELRGVRTGRANTGLIEYVKVEYYGSATDLRELAMITVSDATQLVVKPFDPGATQDIVKGLQQAGLGLNPMSEGKQIRINIPALSGERRNQMVASVKQMGEQAKVAIRNARRDANKHLDQMAKDKSLHVSEDAVKQAKDEIQESVKQHETNIDHLIETKVKEVQEV
jgi:ribosome recycling factor